VRAIRGEVQLTLRVDENAGMNNPRNSVSFPLDWSADNQTKMLNFVNDIRERMEANSLSPMKVVFILLLFGMTLIVSSGFIQ